MNPMMTWSVEEPLKPNGHSINGLCVQPELIDQTHTHHRDDHDGVESQKRQWTPEEVFNDSFAHALTQRCAVVVILGVVVRGMARP